ncbi:site-specific DNA-methyltransferase [Aequorivita sp. KMM 9714]|uniref:site-specific DNA-methyltransferase n=1 Tax=Aequorivita sp. KMM 9714 TaxID=2707173 RepID=UPI0013EDA25F|nr:site-specific DNA-methyltransferase [Aequorivita sp. KMM 9714]NGX84717.1 site-specific DNA-methyltransferase [Aequorivita sp. KMM 9714]
MNKKDILNKIKSLDGLSQEERAYLVNLVNTKKKYGLVWEDKPEDVEEQLRTKLPVLQEVKERAIINDTDGENHPNHILIEGDNLHALTALTFTHENKIDLIYIDPPYNTGNKDFIYNDRYVDKEDAFRHSTWLSFMEKRLLIAKKLLSENGVIFISIDDYSHAQLKLLCDEIFENSSNPDNWNNLSTLIWNKQHSQQQGVFKRYHEYILVYAKNKNKVKNIKGASGIIEAGALKKISVKNPASEFTFPKGVRFEAKEGTEIEGTYGGSEKLTITSGKLICKNGCTAEEVTISAGWTQKNQMKSWFSGNDTVDTKGQKVLEFYFTSTGKVKCRKERGSITPPSILPEYGMVSEQTAKLNAIFGKTEVFTNPKPVEMIKDFCSWFAGEDSIVLDFFAGSGTTLHSVIELNASDNKNRHCILVTNNENNIAEEVTYERNKRIIQGYTNTKGENIKGLINNNLRYYQTSFVDGEPSLNNKRQLTKLATELLCIKEGCYNEVQHELNITPQQAQIFTNGKGKYLVTIYHSRHQLEIQEQLVIWLDNLKDTTEKVRLYAFSPEKEVLAEEFYEVEDKVEVVPLPEAIYNAYLATIKTLKLDKKQFDNKRTAEA